MRELNARCLAAKAARPERQLVLGIALDAKDVKRSSEDFILMDTVEWSEEMLKKAQEIREADKFFLTAASRIDEQEYPDAAAKNGRLGSWRATPMSSPTPCVQTTACAWPEFWERNELPEEVHTEVVKYGE